MWSPKKFVFVFIGVWAVLLAVASAFQPPFFRPYEILRNPNGINFLPGRVVEMDEYGVLAFNEHLVDLRVTKFTTFTTDPWGFRNLPIGRARVIVTGDSFIVGVGASDDETFSVFLSGLLEEAVYNYGGQRSWAAPYFLADRRFVEHPPDLVLWMPSQMRLQPILPLDRGTRTQRPEAPSALSSVLATWNRGGIGLARVREIVNRDNGLRWTFAENFQRARHALIDVPGQIEVDGQPALAMTPKQQLMTKSPKARRIDEVVETFLGYRDAVAARGIGFVFAPIPGQGEIYLDRFGPAEREGAIMNPSFREMVLARMKEAGVAVVDLGPAFRANREPYLFGRDDTHWTPRTAQLAAREVAEFLQSHPALRPSSEHPKRN